MSEDHDYANPDPACYRLRSKNALSPEVAQDVGIVESWWEPLDEHDHDVAAYTAGLARQPVLSLQDIRHYKPLQMVFGLPTPARGTEFTDDWFETLMSVLRHLVDEWGNRAFGSAVTMPVHARTRSVDASVDASSPWSVPLPAAFVLYAGDVATTDANDGGWDALLLDAVQRAALVKGVLAKLLDEHVFSDLLFGGTARQKQLLAHLDATMLTSDGFVRKLKRCEEVQRILAQESLTAQFWDAVDRVTADTAQMLLPIVDLQRHMLIAACSKSDDTTLRAPVPLGLCALYQGLYDIVAVAGYASLHMVRSTSIFQIEFPEADQLWDVDQHRAEDDPVYASSVRRARAVDTKRTMAGAYNNDDDGDDDDGFAAPTRVDKIKIVVWPRIRRFKPVWNHARNTVRSATRTCISKSYNLYYCGEAGTSSAGVGDDNAADSATLELFEHIEQAKAARATIRRHTTGASYIWWLLVVCVLFVGVLAYLHVWHGAGDDAVRQLVVAHAMLVADSATSAFQVALDTARAAPGHAEVAAVHFVDTVVKPAVDRLTSKAAFLGSVHVSQG